MHLILVVAVAAILAPASSPAPLGTHVAMGSGGISIGGGCPGNPGTCAFTLSVTDPNLIFFRWDFDGDGYWDSGYPPFNTWVIDLTAVHTYPSGGRWTVCAQGWDGLTTRRVGSTWVAIGPITCKRLVLGGDFAMSPASWDRVSTGTVYASWNLPGGFVPSAVRAREATIAGVPATPTTVIRSLGGSTVAIFEVDRAALTAVLGPGTHYVRLQGVWVDTTVSVWGGAQFSADGQVTIT